MQRKRLVATVAAAPILVLAHGAMAQVSITTETTTPVATATAGTGGTAASVTVTNAGSIKPPAATSGAALLMNSNNDITNQGTISVTDSTGTIAGMATDGGRLGIILNSGSIALVEDTTASDTDNDGDADGDFATGANRTGILVEGGLTGAVTNSGTINIEGNDSYGIRIEGDLSSGVATGHTGTLTHSGGIAVVGDNARGISLTGGTVDGSVEVRGSVATIGENAVAVDVDSDVTGTVRIQGAVSSRGYRYQSRPTTDAALDALDADDLLQHDGAVRVTGNVGTGVIVDTRPTDNDADDADEDNDGIDDAAEGTGSITSLGEAPALAIGGLGAENIVIGRVAATGDDAHGLVVKGAVTGSGLFDGVSGTGIQIGGLGTGTTTLTGGMRLDGDVRGIGIYNTGTAVRLGAGAVLDGALVNDGSVLGQAVNKSGPTPPDLSGGPFPGFETGQQAIAISIEGNAVVPSIVNTGDINAVIGGEQGTATAIKSTNSSLTSITNSGRIIAQFVPTDDASDTDDADTSAQNETIHGQAIAIDLSASTAGATINQVAGDDEEVTPLIRGDVLLGSGDDALDIQAGTLFGDVNLGAGANSFTLDGGSVFSGFITGTTTANRNHDLAFTNGQVVLDRAETIYADSLTVGAETEIFVTVDAAAGTATMIDVNTADFAEGSKIGVQVSGLLDLNAAGAGDYLIVNAGTLTGTVTDNFEGATPFLYRIGVTADEATDEVRLQLRRRTAAEANLNAAETAAFNAFYGAIAQDMEVQTAILQQTTEGSFKALYDQLLPDQGEGLFSALEMAELAIGRAVATRPDLRGRYGPDSFWVQELNMQVKRDGGETLGSEAKGFGFVAGYESMSAKGGALGATLAYISAEEQDDAARVGEQTTAAVLEGGVYWRQSAGSWLFSVRGGGGYAWFDGTRRFLYAPNSALPTGVIRNAEAEWNGLTASAHASVRYEQRFGRFYARPGLAVDYFYLKEDEREEEGAGALNLTVADRTSSRLSSTFDVAFGAEFGRAFWWRPEMRIGYRQILSGEIGDTEAAFAGGAPFTVSAMDPGEGAAIVALALKMGTAMSYLALEGEAEAADGEERYNVHLTGRVMF